MTRNFIYAALMLAVTLTAHGQELFLTANDAVERLEPEPSVVRSRSAVFDKNQLLDSLADGSPLVLNLFPDARFEATVKETRRVSRGSSFVYATLPDGGHATLFVAGGIVRGEVHSPSGIFTVRSSGGGQVRIRQLDPSALPPVDHGTLGRSWDDALQDWKRRTTLARQYALRNDDEEATEDVGPDETVDLLVVYTPGAEALEEDNPDVKLPGRAATEATIIAEVEKANQALANSGLEHRRFRLVGMVRVAHAQSVGHLVDDLSFLRNRKSTRYDPDGILDEIHELRGRHAADLVSLVVERPISACGIANNYSLYGARSVENRCMNDTNPRQCIARMRRSLWQFKSYSVSAIPRGCTIQNALTHEVGHNLGLFHDRYVESYLSLAASNEHFPSKPYGFGYVNQNFDRSICFNTMMAYKDQCVDEGYVGSNGVKEH